MFDASSYFIYLLASTALILVPGPAQALVLAQTLSRGGKAGVLTALGLNVGTLLHSIAVGVLNPKVAIFFLAFLPQFVDPAHGNVVLQFLVLGATMAVLDVLYEVALVQVFSRLRERYLASRWLTRWQAKISGLVFIALGARLAAQGR